MNFDNILGTALAVLIVLKAAGLVTWTWAVVLTPLWIYIFIIIIVLLYAIGTDEFK